ncbi:uncharacterized MFS-type transporter C09D4.1-like [Neodiprion pinetum]|uniref:Uncharacterized MFS-type transporter C09D4.1 n=1 Tax=Neodiprion lecontei TaxID=441921 RepID=A0A6J0BST1_NEOLC|nr:uncharacterized MFS-type transporter C09D4.1 [Neodiprion lecontei]XP_046426836.1 uncharacterized MFS-type transporter C09D4.1-like [Neodiprion fabricii]XP_046487870.1 uncharacterized MFS-type transporter C09D4.1-like [Neodiprion pinetum]XP_046620205.1 uncharacterized MFS-type transporter C09D4.1-like [Neodiprion virginianus]
MVAAINEGFASAPEVITVQENDFRMSAILESEKTLGEDGEKTESEAEIKVYKRRWLQLGLFFIYGASNNMHWIQFTIVGNIISKYYGVSPLAVDWTSTIFHVMYVALMLPASYVMDRVGLRWACLIGSLGISIGSWIKFFSASPDRFVVAFVGQTIVASAQVFVSTGPVRLSALWFGSNQVATATSIGCFGPLMGISTLFLITPMIVRDHENIEDIGNDLTLLFLGMAILSTIVTVALFFFFRDEPRLPPSEARALQKANSEAEAGQFWPTLKRILSNKSFLMLWNSYGISGGVLDMISALVNPFLLFHFKNGEEDAGRLGLLMWFTGSFASIIFGMILDKTKKFKALNIFIYAFTLVGEILFAVGLLMEIRWVVYLAIIVLGVFGVTYGSIGFELAAESTYPEPENVTSGLLRVANQLYGAIMVVIAGALLRTYGDVVAHGCLIIVVGVGLALVVFVKTDLKRLNAKEHCDPKRNRVAESQVVEPETIQTKL